MKATAEGTEINIVEGIGTADDATIIKGKDQVEEETTTKEIKAEIGDQEMETRIHTLDFLMLRVFQK